MPIEVFNPTTGELLGRQEPVPAAELRRIVAHAHEAFLSWRGTAFEQRAETMLRAAQLLRGSERDHARRMAVEMGKPIGCGLEEVRACANVCEWFAANAQRLLAPEPVDVGPNRCYIVFRPLGVIFSVQPWNWPYHQVFRMAVPALMAGNAVVIKHASNTPGCAAAIESVFHQAGVPSRLLRVLLMDSRDTGSVISDPLVRGVSLTGSGRAGASVGQAAGAHLKKSVLELGGSDPYLILADADIERAARLCVQARLMNSGASCIAGKRMIVVPEVRAAFERRFTELMAAARVGDPLLETTDVGPMARTDLRDELDRQVRASVDAGARLLLGGWPVPGPGAFYPCTVLTDVHKGMPAFDEELFGPVAAIVPVGSEREAIDAANDSKYGLGACVLTRDAARGERIAADLLDCGMAWVNLPLWEDPRLPFGGVKESGYGRELSGYGLKEFVNIKTVCIAAS
jgi:succinate-semialdehyde dehydrogenase/glutarate-semialdehyde dehydrogenase